MHSILYMNKEQEKTMKHYRSGAFTLAEVLVTLTIIGVIASLTIPSLRKVSDEKAYVSGLLKAYSELSSATKLIRRESGPVALWANYSSDEAAASVIEKYKSVMPSVGNPSLYTIQTLNGATSSVDSSSLADSTRTILAADGALYNLASVNNCTAADAVSKNCFRFIVDVNGKKDPNMIGVDVYAFDVMKNGDVLPAQGKCPPDEKSGDSSGQGNGSDASGSGSSGSSSGQDASGEDGAGGGQSADADSEGWGCTARVLQEKDISW